MLDSISVTLVREQSVIEAGIVHDRPTRDLGLNHMLNNVMDFGSVPGGQDHLTVREVRGPKPESAEAGNNQRIKSVR